MSLKGSQGVREEGEGEESSEREGEGVGEVVGASARETHLGLE